MLNSFDLEMRVTDKLMTYHDQAVVERYRQDKLFERFKFKSVIRSLAKHGFAKRYAGDLERQV